MSTSNFGGLEKVTEKQNEVSSSLDKNSPSQKNTLNTTSRATSQKSKHRSPKHRLSISKPDNTNNNPYIENQARPSSNRTLIEEDRQMYQSSINFEELSRKEN